MRIGIDMRMAGTGEGIGRYVEELVKHLSQIDHQNQYFLITNRKFSIFNFQFSKNFQTVEVNSKYYSFAEQTKFIWELKKLKLDLMHFTSFNVPIFYPEKFVVTIHDIIHHMYPGKKKSRLLHRLAYRLVFASAVSRAQKIMAVSQETKKAIIKTFGMSPQKIDVIYEGVDEKFTKPLAQIEIVRTREKYAITKPYLLFTGVWRQYKNLERLAQAFDILIEQYGHDLELVLAGKIDPFYPEIQKAVLGIKHAARVRALGFIPDSDLAALYQGAEVFVLSSLVEGFGLIGVEAQASGVPVAASDIPVLREVLGEGAVYFDPKNPEHMAQVINLTLRDGHLRQRLKEQSATNIKKFNWRQTAEKTLKVYQNL